MTVADGINTTVNALSVPSAEITLEGGVGIEDYNLKGVNVYGYGNTIFISSKNIDFNNAEVSVYNTAGQEVLYANINGKNAQVQLNKVSEGFYFVNLRMEEGLITRKVHIRQ